MKNQHPFDKEALRYLRGTLNEVLNGLRLPEQVGQQMHPLRPAMKALLGALRQEQYRLSADDAMLLLQTSAVCDRELEGWEFETRLGYTRVEAEQVLAELHRVVQSAAQSHAAAS